MDIQKIEQTLSVFGTDNGLIEIRAFNSKNDRDVQSGIFSDYELLKKSVEYLDNNGYNVYFIFNELKDAVSGLAQINKMLKGAKSIKDSDVKYRRWLMLDFDPIREGNVKDVASSDEEQNNARLVALEARKHLRSLGFELPVVCKSGNGYHLMFAVPNVECNPDTDKVFENILKYLSLKFTDDKVDVDTKVFNRARLTKFYSTLSKKGGNTDDRPFRYSEIIQVPEELKKTHYGILKNVSDVYESIMEKPNTTQNRGYSGYNGVFNVDDFLSKHGIEIRKEVIQGDGTRKLLLANCVFDPSHKYPDAAIIVGRSGEIGYHCFHNSCSGYKWRDVRLKFEPNAYDEKPQYNNNFQRGQYQQPLKKKVEVKPENPDIGKKWLRMKDIKSIDLSSIEKFKTGYKDLDEKISGLHVGEVSIVSGSNASGKSSWLNSLALNICNSGEKVAIWSGELQSVVLKEWLAAAACGRNNMKQSKYDNTKMYVPESTKVLIENWLDDKLFIYNNDYGSNWAQVFSDMKEIVEEGVKVCILDNLFSLDINIFDGDKNNKQKELILQLCDYVKKSNIHVILVCHPRKVVSFLRKDDIAGSSDLMNAVSNIFICHRTNNDFLKRGNEFFGNGVVERYSNYGNVIEVAKNRMYGVVDHLVGLYYEMDSRRFKNYEHEDVKYGWEDQPVQQTLGDENEFAPEPDYFSITGASHFNESEVPF